MAEKINIENVLSIGGLIVGKKVEEQRADAGFLQRLRDVCVARAQPAAAASMREKYNAYRVLRYSQRSFRLDRIGRNPYLLIGMLSLHSFLLHRVTLERRADG